MQAVMVFVKPGCRKCGQQAKTIARLAREARNFMLLDVWQHKLEAEQAGVTEDDAPTAIVLWDGVEQYRTTNLVELLS